MFHVVIINIQTLTSQLSMFSADTYASNVNGSYPCFTPKTAFFRMKDRLFNKTILIVVTTFLVKRDNDTEVVSCFTILLFQIIYAIIRCLCCNTSKIEQNRSMKLFLHKTTFNTRNKQFHYSITVRTEFLSFLFDKSTLNIDEVYLLKVL